MNSQNIQNEIENFCAIIIKVKEFMEQVTSFNRTFILKNDGSPVSQLDLEIETLIKELIEKYIPRFQLISEESDIPSVLRGNYIVVDPIDGTENFVSGIPLWGIGIAIFIENILVGSWILFPEIKMEITSSAVRSVMNQELDLFRSPVSASRVVAFSSNTDWKNEISDFPGELRVFGCSLFNLVLATKGATKFIGSRKGAKVWDIVPAMLIAIENGRKVLVNGKEYKREFLDPNKRYMVEIW